MCAYPAAHNAGYVRGDFGYLRDFLLLLRLSCQRREGFLALVCVMGDESLALESGLLKSSGGPAESFTAFALPFEPRLRRGLIPVLGVDLATDAAAEALAYGWENWDRVGAMENPQGYLYRVARTAGRRLRHRPVAEPVIGSREIPWVEPGLPDALASLSDRQRSVVWLVHGFGWKQTDVAEMLGLSAKSVQTHLRRGTEKLAKALGGE